MPAGRTNQPLVIWVDNEYEHRPEIQALAAQGHNVLNIQVGGVLPQTPPDLILHPAAHQMNEHLFDYLPAALAAARKRKKEGKK